MDLQAFLPIILFWILAGLTGLCAIAVVVTQNIVRCAAWLLFTLAGTAGEFFFFWGGFVGAGRPLFFLGGGFLLGGVWVLLWGGGAGLSVRKGGGGGGAAPGAGGPLL